MNIEKMKGCVIMSTNYQKKTNDCSILASVYGFNPYRIKVIHKNGKKGRVNVYALAYACAVKTLKKAVTKRAIELYDSRFNGAVYDWQDMIATATSALLLAYTDGKGKHHNGYYTDRVASYSKLTATCYSAINAYLWDRNFIGRNIGKEILTDDFAIVHNVVNLFGYVASGRTTVNAVKFNRFIDDIKKHIQNTNYLKVLDCIIDNDYINADGSIVYSALTATLDCNKMTISRAMKAIKNSALDVINGMNMDVDTFVTYLQTA